MDSNDIDHARRDLITLGGASEDALRQLDQAWLRLDNGWSDYVRADIDTDFREARVMVQRAHAAVCDMMRDDTDA